jgi:phage gpG-like protein
MSFTVDLDGPSFQQAVARIRLVTKDLTELMTVLAGRVVRIVDRRFQKSGPRWVPLSERTLERRRAGSSKPLLDTGRLRASVVGRGEGSLYAVDSQSLTIGSDLVYAAIQQYGWPAGGKHPPPTIPARPYIPTEAEILAELTPVVDRYLQEKLK